jgi:hypothetical protein
LWLMLVLELWHRNFLEAQLGQDAWPGPNGRYQINPQRTAPHLPIGSEPSSCPTQS